MNPDKTPEQLINEIVSLRQQLGHMEKTEKEHHKMVDALKKERNFSSAVLDTVGALVIVLDRQGRIVSFNKTCEYITGYSVKEVFSKYIWEVFIIPEEIKPVKDTFARLVGTKLSSKFENYWVTKDAKRRLISWSNSVLLDDDNSVEFIIGTGIDITERRQADGSLFTMLFTLAPVFKEGRVAGGVGFGVDIGRHKLMAEALHESQKRYQALAEAAHDMIFIVDRKYYIQYVNGFGAKQFDALPPDIIGKSLAELFPATSGRMQDNVGKVFSTGQPLCVSTKTHYPKHELWIETWLAPIMDSKNSTVISVMGIARDITQIKRQDDEILRSKQLLESIIEGISDSVFLLSRDLRIVWANHAAAKETGYSREELIGNFCYKVT